MTRLSTRMGVVAGRTSAQRFFIFGLILAFLAQAQLAATHFHIGTDAREQALFGLADAMAPAKGKAPAGDRDCPTSQLVAANHNYLAGSGVALSVPTLIAHHAFIQRAESQPVALIALNWQSRAPPCDISKA